MTQELSARESRHALSGFVQAIRDDDVASAVVIAVGRADGLSLTDTDTDRRWREAAEELSEDDVRVLGVHLITRHGARSLAA
ncbi:MAG: hypothetical protein LH645_04365 [Actinomycetia bacterium]|nr:hypothetical protein [Actinomycetes bacterium]